VIVASASPRRLDGPVVLCAVNFSEGRREDLIRDIAAAMSGTTGAVLADCSADPDHNRMVATLLGEPEAVVGAVIAGARVALERIDMRTHAGVHPRLGAIDVVPIVPIRGVTMDSCLDAASTLGAILAGELGLPVFFYERSARHAHRSALPDIRRGGFEGMTRHGLRGERAPDLGPGHPHPTAGAVIVGARGPLVACNILLDTAVASVAHEVAALIRSERPHVPAIRGVRALGLALASRGLSQVSMNLTHPESTPLQGVFDYVRQEAEPRGANLMETEVIGLLPASSLIGTSHDALLWRAYRPAQVLDNWL
jgi:glutamate formiminotransferase / 5-formyltetrahydrofolate cyclo-ligase